MAYLKSALVGVAAAVAASLIWILAVFVLPIAAPFLISRVFGTDGGGAAGASVGSGSIMVVGLWGFLAGFFWHVRRVRKSQRRTRTASDFSN